MKCMQQPSMIILNKDMQLKWHQKSQKAHQVLSGDINAKPGPTTVTNNSISTTVTNNSIPLNTLPFHNHREPTIPPNAIALGCCKAYGNFQWKIFNKKGLHILHLNINSLWPKIDEINFIAKQSNASIIGISESKLDSSIFKSELDIDEYDLIRLDRSRREEGLHDIIESPCLIIIRQVSVVTLKTFLETFSCPGPSQFW